MDLEQLEFQISQHLDGTLPAAERAALLQRIESDPVARELFETHRRIDAELRTGLRTPAVNWGRLAEHLSARVAEADEAQAPAPSLKLTFVRRMMPYAIAAMVLIVTAIAIKLFTGDPRQPGAPAAVATVQGPEAEHGAGPQVADVSIGPAPNLSPDWRAAEAVVATPNRVIWIASGADPGQDTQRLPY
jgi:anti-sigma factor RsiW